MESENESRGIRTAIAIQSTVDLEERLGEQLAKSKLSAKRYHLYSDLFDHLVDREMELVYQFASYVASCESDQHGDFWSSIGVVAEALLATDLASVCDPDWAQTCYDEVKRLAIVLANIVEIER